MPLSPWDLDTEEWAEDELKIVDLEVLEAANHEAALRASQDPSPPTPEELEEEAALDEFIRTLTVGANGRSGRRARNK